MTANTLAPVTARALIQPYYDALLAKTPENVRSIAEGVTTEDWTNCTDDDVCEKREEAIARWAGHIALIPDLDLQIREVLVSGDKVVVRGRMTGTPTAEVMGVAPQGHSFSIMTCDIHTIRHGKIARSFHLEDWARGISQMRGDEKQILE